MITVVVPIYHDAYFAEAFCKELQHVMQKLLSKKDIKKIVELIFVNDGSTDNSLDTLLNLAKKYSFIKVIDLSRNFGQHAAIACGLLESKGEIVLRANVDMQDPLDQIPRFLSVMKKEECDLVIGQYKKRNSRIITKIHSYFFYHFFNFLTGFKIPQNTSALRAMSRKYVEEYNKLTEKSRFPQGLDHWLGFKHKYIKIDHKKRIDNKSSYSFYSRMKMSIDAIIYFSERPLILIVLFGFLLALVGFILVAGLILKKFIGIDFIPGYLSTISILVLFFGAQFFSFGVVGLYVAKTFREVQNRPLFIIRDRYL